MNTATVRAADAQPNGGWGNCIRGLCNRVHQIVILTPVPITAKQLHRTHRRRRPRVITMHWEGNMDYGAAGWDINVMVHGIAVLDFDGHGLTKPACAGSAFGPVSLRTERSTGVQIGGTSHGGSAAQQESDCDRHA